MEKTEFEQIESLIKLMSKSDLTSLQLKTDGIQLVLKKEKEKEVIASLPAAAETVKVLEQKEKASAEFNNPDEVVTAPLVGTFYAAPSEDAEPFVSVGDRVKKGQVLGIIEAMKLMNEIECEYDGVVADILVQNKDIVEYGQPLFRIAKP
ncbi:MAG: acetyl-CoA carboxylase biotin carboxyl carrier protein [Clostridiales bacterium]|nr:acetyl-CoA carboxylase biotin carboxyl carrier protein [Clostridiales bacterium]